MRFSLHRRLQELRKAVDASWVFYILHPNNAGHCAHIANASYGVSSEARGTGMGERLVRHSLEMCRKHGFVGLQFNAVVSSNTAAIRLYEKLGFERIGTTKNGYRFKDGPL